MNPLLLVLDDVVVRINGLLQFPNPIRLRVNDSDEVFNSLGAEGVLPGRQIEGFLRDFKQFAHILPSRQIES